MKYGYLALLLFLFLACSSRQENSTSKPIARVGERYLYEDDIGAMLPKNMDTRDSAVMIKKVVDDWVRQTLIVYEAKKIISAEESADINDRLENYKQELVRYAYERHLISSKLDTAVSDEEVGEYYQKHKSNFELTDNIIKVLYVKVKKDAPDLNDVREWCRSGNEEEVEKLRDFCLEYGVNCFLDDDWLLFDDLLKEVPIKTYNKEQYLKNHRYVETRDSLYVYLLNIKGFKIKNTLSPLGFEKERIKSIILNQRKLRLIKDMENKIYQEALIKNQIDVYQP